MTNCRTSNCKEIFADAEERAKNAPRSFIAQKGEEMAMVSLGKDRISICNQDRCLLVPGQRSVLEEVKFLYDVLGFSIRDL